MLSQKVTKELLELQKAEAAWETEANEAMQGALTKPATLWGDSLRTLIQGGAITSDGETYEIKKAEDGLLEQFQVVKHNWDLAQAKLGEPGRGNEAATTEILNNNLTVLSESKKAVVTLEHVSQKRIKTMIKRLTVCVADGIGVLVVRLFWVHSIIIAPINQTLSSIVNSVADGDLTERSTYHWGDEIGLRSQGLLRMTDNLESKRTLVEQDAAGDHTVKGLAVSSVDSRGQSMQGKKTWIELRHSV